MTDLWNAISAAFKNAETILDKTGHWETLLNLPALNLNVPAKMISYKKI